jgi:uncharacterized protein (DUF1800 family)
MGTHDVVTGVPNYTEDDVKQIARAFTGWRYTIKDGKKPRAVFFVDDTQHDNGSKTIYGQQANFGGEDVITVICARRATARFLVTKLFQFFVYPLTSSAQDQATTEKFADAYFSNDHSMKELLRAIFSSDEFFSQRARFALVKSPAELIAGTIRMLATTYNPGNLDNGDFDLVDQFRRMGLDLFNPFDVSGWKLNLGWLNTSTALERMNFASNLMSNRDFSKGSIGASVSNDFLKSHVDPNPATTVRNFLQLLGPLQVGNDAVQTLTDYLQTDDDGTRIPFVPSADTIDKLVRGLVYLILCLPEYQMN